MNKFTTTILLLAAAAILSLASCSDTTVQKSTIKVRHLSDLHTYTSAQGMHIYQGATNYSIVSGGEASTVNSITISYLGIDTGTYPVGPSYGSTIAVAIGSLNYSSLETGAYGTIHISKLDPTTMTATGTFSGRLMNNNVHGDSLPLTDGEISVKYQF